MNDAKNMIENEIPAYKKKSKKKGQSRADHKHIYETVLLCRNWHHKDLLNGEPKVSQKTLPTKVCVICGRVHYVDTDPSYYDEKPKTSYIPFLTERNLSDKALKLPKWYTNDFWEKFAIPSK